MEQDIEIPLTEKSVVCDSCKTKIAEIAVIGVNKNVMKYKFLCPICDNKTFVIKCEGRSGVSIPDEFNILDVEYKEDTNLQYFKLGKRNG
jgi:hypothetical protein